MNTTTLPKLLELSVNAQDKISIYNIYMPYLKNGGLFIACNVLPNQYKLGQKAIVNLVLPGIEPLDFIGEIIWISPSAHSHRVSGLGVEFPDHEDTNKIRRHIESLLGQALYSNRATHIL